MLNDKLNTHEGFPPAIVAPPTMRYHPTRYYGTFASGEAVTGNMHCPPLYRTCALYILS